MAAPPLATLFRENVHVGELTLDDGTLEVLLRGIIAEGRAAWPGIDVDDATFVAFVAERLEDPGSLATCRAADLFIACAAALGRPGAIAAFEASFFPELRKSLGRLRLDPTTFDEAKQKLRRELFVAEPGKRPKIAEFGGRGDLRGWFRVTAVRSALKIVRSSRSDKHVDDERLLARVPAASDDPELGYLKELYRPAFKKAFQDALDSLSPREQNLLRQHHVDGLSVDQLGALYRVHRATAARWIAGARRLLLKRTRERFKSSVGISATECDSIMRLVHSQLDMTIRRRLSAVGA